MTEEQLGQYMNDYDALLALDDTPVAAAREAHKRPTDTDLNRALKQVVIRPGKEGFAEDEKCVVCQEEFQDKEKARIIRSCPCKNQYYHFRCIKEWLHSDLKASGKATCPTCRKAITVD